MARYNFRETEAKWQRIWEERGCFHAETEPGRRKAYVLEMFPYPSGRIHMGHVKNYTLGDLTARFRRAQGFNVLHPMGWDAFGLPAENAAFENKVHPAVWTRQNIAAMRTQLKSIGLSFDWNREIATCEPAYYRHEQAMFLDFLANGLAYRRESWVNWDPVENTVLANEQVIDGHGWRSGAPVERRKLSQWFSKSPTLPTSFGGAADRSIAGPTKCGRCSRTGSVARPGAAALSTDRARPLGRNLSRHGPTRCSAHRLSRFRPTIRWRLNWPRAIWHWPILSPNAAAPAPARR